MQMVGGLTHPAMKQQYTVKLSFENATRRVSFPSQPTWPQLAAHIETHFHISPKRAAAKYTDSDGDEILISTDEELQEYYDSEPKTVKLTVHQLPDASTTDHGGNEPHKTAEVETKEAEGSGKLDLHTEVLARSDCCSIIDADDSDEGTQRPAVTSRESRTQAPSQTPTDDEEPLPAKGKGKQKQTASSKGKGKTKGKGNARTGRRAAQLEATRLERVPSNNRTRGDHHKSAPSGPKRAQGHHQRDNDEDDDDDEDDDEDDDDEDEGNFDNAGGDVREFNFALNINGDISGSDSDSSSSSGDSEDNAPPRGRGKNKKKGGKRRQQNSQQDVAGPFNTDPWGNNGFASPPPMWSGGFPGQFDGGLGWSSSGSKSGKGGRRTRSNVFADVSADAQSHFPGFDFKTWQMKPNAVADIFSNMRSGHF